MNNQLNRACIGEGVYFSSVTDPKFKHNRITVNLVVDLAERTAADNAIVPYLLRRGCKSAPDMTSLNRKLCELYGAALASDVSKYAQSQVLELAISGIDDRFTFDGTPLTEQCASLLCEVLFEPNLAAGLFGEAETEREKQEVIDAIESLLNDKRAYALSRCKAAMCAGEPMAVERYGGIEHARQVTSSKATEAYRRVLKTARVEIIFAGCGEPGPAREIFRTAFAAHERDPQPLCPMFVRGAPEQPREEIERLDVAQGKLVLGFRTGVLGSGADVMAMRLMCALYGGTPNSKLFLNVREKLSLCYYCASRYDRLTGLVFVDSGVEFANRAQAQEEILNQLALLQQGTFTDEELDAARMLMKNALNSVTDSLGGLSDWYLTQILCGSAYTPAVEATQLDAVTREQVTEAARRVQLDTVYFLTGKEAV